MNSIQIQKKRVLFLCVANSCRSQIAEGLTRHYLGHYIEVESAGFIGTFVHPMAIRVMGELGIDISNQVSKPISGFDDRKFDIIITLCEDADALCPVWFGGGKQVHIGFPDPVRVTGKEEKVLEAFRKTRDDIKEQILTFLKHEYNIT